MLKVFVGLQVIDLCCLCDTVDHSGCLGSVYGINDFPVLLSDAETTDGTLAKLSLYEDKHRNVPSVLSPLGVRTGSTWIPSAEQKPVPSYTAW